MKKDYIIPFPEAYMPKFPKTDEELIGNIYTGKVIDFDSDSCILEIGGNRKGYMPISHLNIDVPHEYYLGKLISVCVKKYNSEKEMFLCSRKKHIIKTVTLLKENIKQYNGIDIIGVVFKILEDGSALIDIGGGYLANISKKDLGGIELKENTFRDDFIVLPFNSSFKISLKTDNHIGDILQIEVDGTEYGIISCHATQFPYKGVLDQPYKKICYEKGDCFPAYVIEVEDNNVFHFIPV